MYAFGLGAWTWGVVRGSTITGRVQVRVVVMVRVGGVGVGVGLGSGSTLLSGDELSLDSDMAR